MRIFIREMLSADSKKIELYPVRRLTTFLITGQNKVNEGNTILRLIFSLAFNLLWYKY